MMVEWLDRIYRPDEHTPIIVVIYSLPQIRSGFNIFYDKF